MKYATLHTQEARDAAQVAWDLLCRVGFPLPAGVSWEVLGRMKDALDSAPCALDVLALLWRKSPYHWIGLHAIGRILSIEAGEALLLADLQAVIHAFRKANLVQTGGVGICLATQAVPFVSLLMQQRPYCHPQSGASFILGCASPKQIGNLLPLETCNGTHVCASCGNWGLKRQLFRGWPVDFVFCLNCVEYHQPLGHWYKDTYSEANQWEEVALPHPITGIPVDISTCERVHGVRVRGEKER